MRSHNSSYERIMQVFYLKPAPETYIVTKEPVPEQGYEELEEDIQILTFGFDQYKLEPIISVLMNMKIKTCNHLVNSRNCSEKSNDSLNVCNIRNFYLECVIKRKNKLGDLLPLGSP